MLDNMPISRGQFKEAACSITRDIAVIQNILVESGLTTLEELEQQRVKVGAMIDQMAKEEEDRQLEQLREDDPKAAAAMEFYRRLFGGDE